MTCELTQSASVEELLVSAGKMHVDMSLEVAVALVRRFQIWLSQPSMAYASLFVIIMELDIVIDLFTYCVVLGSKVEVTRSRTVTVLSVITLSTL